MSPRGGPTALLLAALVAGCGHPPPAAVQVLDIHGAPHRPLQVADGTVHVMVFTSQECPIANSYAPTLRELAARWHQQPVQLYLVHVDPELTAPRAREHSAAYELPGHVVLDPEHQLARRLGVARTPEAVVLTGTGIAYRGRIDDQWSGLGTRSPAAGATDLADAVRTVLGGGVVAKPFPPAVGCLLPEPARR